jgi:nucleoside-diphosphate-sugar epimerase
MGRRCFFSPQKARTQLGWQPAIGYDEGIAAAVKWCVQNVKC